MGILKSCVSKMIFMNEELAENTLSNLPNLGTH